MTLPISVVPAEPRNATNHDVSKASSGFIPTFTFPGQYLVKLNRSVERPESLPHLRARRLGIRSNA
jgi:hypothetical protein